MLSLRQAASQQSKASFDCIRFAIFVLGYWLFGNVSIWDNESTAIKHFLTEFARLAQTAIEKVAQWFVWICKQVGQLNDCELRRADSEIMDLVDGRYDGRIRRFENRYGGLSR